MAASCSARRCVNGDSALSCGALFWTIVCADRHVDILRYAHVIMRMHERRLINKAIIAEKCHLLCTANIYRVIMTPMQIRVAKSDWVPDTTINQYYEIQLDYSWNTHCAPDIFNLDQKFRRQNPLF